MLYALFFFRSHTFFIILSFIASFVVFLICATHFWVRRCAFRYFRSFIDSIGQFSLLIRTVTGQSDKKRRHRKWVNARAKQTILPNVVNSISSCSFAAHICSSNQFQLLNHYTDENVCCGCTYYIVVMRFTICRAAYDWNGSVVHTPIHPSISICKFVSKKILPPNFNWCGVKLNWQNQFLDRVCARYNGIIFWAP